MTKQFNVGIKIFTRNISTKAILNATRVSVAGLETDVLDSAQTTSEPLVILHGLFGSGTNWRSMAKTISPLIKQDVYCIDLRNHGSSFHNLQMDYPTMAGDVCAWLKEKKVAKFSMLGHSMGGKVAMYFAINEFGKSIASTLTKLVTVDISLSKHTPSEDIRKYVSALSYIEQNQMTRQEADKYLEGSVVPEKGIRQFLLTNYVPTDNKAFRMRVNVKAIDNNLPFILQFPKLDSKTTCCVPTLIVAGSKSNYVSEECERHLTKLFTRSRVQHIANAGHWVHADQPVAFVNAVVPFLQDEESHI